MALEAKDIGFRYGRDPWIIRGFSLTVRPGEVVGLSGPSGCGKTTLARLLSGYERPLEGGINLDGRPLPNGAYNPVQLIFQHPEKAVNPRWRMRDTITEGWEPVADMLAEFGIEPDWLNRWPNELSAGELQRFCVVRALGPQTCYLIADEMTTMLDAVTQAQIWNVVLDIARRRNLGILAVSHDRHLIDRFCSKVIQLSKDGAFCCS